MSTNYSPLADERERLSFILSFKSSVVTPVSPSLSYIRLHSLILVYQSVVLSSVFSHFLQTFHAHTRSTGWEEKEIKKERERKKEKSDLSCLAPSFAWRYPRRCGRLLPQRDHCDWEGATSARSHRPHHHFVPPIDLIIARDLFVKGLEIERVTRFCLRIEPLEPYSSFGEFSR